jgi:Mg2+ and Co2+ transporter CorA
MSYISSNGVSLLTGKKADTSKEQPHRDTSSITDDSVKIDINEEADAQGGLLRDQPASICLLPGMRINAFSIDAEGELHICDAEEALAKSQQVGGGAFWIDIDADEHDKEELGEWLEKLNLSPFLTCQLAEPVITWNSHVISLKLSALAMIRILPWDESSSSSRQQVQFLAALKSKSLLMTFTSCPKMSKRGICQESIKYMLEPECLPHGSASGALMAWLLFHIERTAMKLREVRHDIGALDEKMDEAPSSVTFEEIKEMKNRLSRILTVAEEQGQCLARLKKAEKDTASLDFSKVKGTLGILMATSESTERMGARQEKLIVDIRHSHASAQQDRINHHLGLLTVLSAIFLPLTLMAGVWGMNFSYMPELQRESAYFWALGLMGTVASCMLCFFWRASWFA